MWREVRERGAGEGGDNPIRQWQVKMQVGQEQVIPPQIFLSCISSFY